MSLSSRKFAASDSCVDDLVDAMDTCYPDLPDLVDTVLESSTSFAHSAFRHDPQQLFQPYQQFYHQSLPQPLPQQQQQHHQQQLQHQTQQGLQLSPPYPHFVSSQSPLLPGSVPPSLGFATVLPPSSLLGQPPHLAPTAAFGAGSDLLSSSPIPLLAPPSSPVASWTNRIVGPPHDALRRAADAGTRK